MTLLFQPKFSITPTLMNDLMRIEAIRQKVAFLGIKGEIRKVLWEKTLCELIRYFRFIEGIKTTPEQLRNKNILFPSDAQELKGYLAALKQVRAWSANKTPISLRKIQTLHAHLFQNHYIADVTPTRFRDGQNAVFNWNLTKILYLPPKAHDVPLLMKKLILWIRQARDLPCPLVAAIAHFSLNAIHPFYDGNGRSARLLSRWILAAGGYDLGGLYCLEKQYANDLLLYYDSLSLGSSKRFYERMVSCDMTVWIEYFCHTLVEAFAFSLRRIQQVNAAARCGGKATP